MQSLEEYIHKNWDKTVRITTSELLAKNKTLLFLPKPYTVPCMDTHFQELYYWDTYFTNRGLILSNRIDMAINNIFNFAYLIDKYGFIPNGSRTWYLNRSQPPFLGMMISDVYKETGDKAFLLWALEALKKEHVFWDTKRKTANGLNCYSATPTLEECRDIIQCYYERTGIQRLDNELYWGINILAEAESGWDFNARFSGKCHEYNPVDLNCLLYFDEKFIAKAERILGLSDGEEWDARAAQRKSIMYSYMLGSDGVLYDYSYVEGAKSLLKSAASFMPYFVGLETDNRGAKELLSALELPFGVAATEELCGVNYQWGYKNGWACLQLIAVEGLRNCALSQEANRISEGFIRVVENVFEQSGKVLEKYNIFDGNANAIGEYGTPEMLGWTAGVYLALKDVMVR